MSIPYTQTGRVRQKGRTASALIAAARALLSSGVTPTVEQAAEHAGISRTTAYRYFRNQRDLLVATYPELGTGSLVDDRVPPDPEERLDMALDRLIAMTRDHEPELRTMLRLSLEPDGGDRPDLLLRQGRAIGWLEDALEPLRDRLGPGRLRRLAYAIRCAVGIEPLVWLTDIGGLDRDEAFDLMRESAKTLYASAVASPS